MATTTLRTTESARRAARAWVAMLHAHTALTRAFNADLQAGHGITVTDFEVLRHLEGAPDGHLRRVDLAQLVGLTPSGITRLLDGLEAGGLVEKAQCTSDARVTYARLTDDGRTLLHRAAATHLAAIDALFQERFTSQEADRLGELLERLPREGDQGSCPHADQAGAGS
ncbi:MAG: MarR family winged helix-turn-helix transcriptional regulator [Miltoncostaeaceae bacterium]